VEGSARVEIIFLIQQDTIPERGFFIRKRRQDMNHISKFYLKQAVYQVEVEGQEAVLLMDYSGNKYEIVGKSNPKVGEIAKLLLGKKHGVNFADKFNGKIDKEIL